MLPRLASQQASGPDSAVRRVSGQADALAPVGSSRLCPSFDEWVAGAHCTSVGWGNHAGPREGNEQGLKLLSTRRGPNHSGLQTPALPACAHATDSSQCGSRGAHDVPDDSRAASEASRRRCRGGSDRSAAAGAARVGSFHASAQAGTRAPGREARSERIRRAEQAPPQKERGPRANGSLWFFKSRSGLAPTGPESEFSPPLPPVKGKHGGFCVPSAG